MSPPETNVLPMGGMGAGDKSSGYCCPGLAVTQREIPLLIGGLRSEIRDNDRLYTQRFEAADRQVVVAMSAAEKAMQTALLVTKEAAEKAATATEKRFDEVSDKLDTLRESLSKQITTATANAALTTGRSGGINSAWIYLIGAISIGSMILTSVIALTAN